jgi:hypothetical protein
LNKELVEGDAVFAPGVNANSQKTLDYFVIWKPNFEMNSSSLSVMDYNVRYYLNAAGADGKSRGPWDSGHGHHGSNATAINIWLTLDSTTNQLNAKIQRNHYTSEASLYLHQIEIVNAGGIRGKGGKGGKGGLDDEVEETLIDAFLNGRGPRGSDGRDGRNGLAGNIDYFLIK